jgi:diguanylate cyclase (GGDEF)-like protein
MPKENLLLSETKTDSNINVLSLIDKKTIEDIPLPICYFAPDGQVLISNDVCKKYFEVTAAKSGRSNIDNYLDKKNLETLKSGTDSITPQNPVTYNSPDLLSFHDGDWCQWVLKGFFDDKGNPLAYGAFGFDVSARKLQLEHLNQKLDAVSKVAYHDKLTRVYNRTYFDEELNRLNKCKANQFKQVSATDRRSKITETIFVVDVDNLKITNDTLGHPAGDHLIKSVARILSASLRPGDIVARVGGDEFAFLVYNGNSQTLSGIKERIETNRIKRNELNSKACTRFGLSPIPVEFSIGYATYNRELDSNLFETYRRADAAMYVEKKQRHNRRTDLSQL